VAQERIETLEARHRAVLQSTSWRLTAPARLIGSFTRPRQQ